MYKKKEIEVKKLDYNFYETVMIVNALNSQEYISAIIEHTDLDYFKDEHNRLFIGNIFSFFKERGTAPSLPELKSRLSTEEDKEAFKKVATKLLTQKLMEEKFNQEELLANTEKFLKDKGLYKAINEAAEQHNAGVVDIDATLADLERVYAITLSENLGLWYFRDTERFIQDLTTTYNPIPTGWDSLESRLEGGLFPKTLTCFIGQVNIGKSIVLGNLAANMTKANKNVLLVSLEMSEFMYAKRISAQYSQIPANQLKSNTDDLRGIIRDLGASLDSNLVIKEYPPKAITVRQLEAYINKLRHNGFKPDVVIIDYLNLIQPATKGLNSYESIKEVAEGLRALAFKFNVPFVTASQVNRGAFNSSNPGMESVSESIALAATCDVMASIWQEEEDKALGILNMGMQKNRFGVNFGTWVFKVKYDTLTLTETNADHFVETSTDTMVSDAANTLSMLEDIIEPNK